LHASHDHQDFFTGTKVDLGYDRLIQTYLKLNSQAVELPLNRIRGGMPKWLQEKLKNEGRQMKSKLYEPKIRRNPLDLKKAASL
jgi:hypothetical protein